MFWGSLLQSPIEGKCHLGLQGSQSLGFGGDGASEFRGFGVQGFGFSIKGEKI